MLKYISLIRPELLGETEMVHSFAIAFSDKPTDLTKAQGAEDRKVYADAGFVALAEQKPRTEAAQARYPEMGEDKETFLHFFRYQVNIGNYVGDVDKEFAAAIGTARTLKVDGHEVFDTIEVRSTTDGSEMLAFGHIQFGGNVLHFLIAQWRIPGDKVDDGYTTIEEIKELRRAEKEALQKREEARREERQAAQAAEKAKRLRNQRFWGYPLLAITLLLTAVVIWAPLVKSPGWLMVGLIGSFFACVTAMFRAAVGKSTFCGIVAGIAFANVLGVTIGLTYLENLGIIK